MIKFGAIVYVKAKGKSDESSGEWVSFGVEWQREEMSQIATANREREWASGEAIAEAKRMKYLW